MHESWLIIAILVPLVPGVLSNVLSDLVAIPALKALGAKVRTLWAHRAETSQRKERFEAAVTMLLNDPRAETRARMEALRLLIGDTAFFLTSVVFAVGTFVFDAMNQKALAAIFYLAMLAVQLMLFLRARRRFRLEDILREVSKRVDIPL